MKVLYPGRKVLTQYLKERDPDDWSYFEFLNLNRDTIIKLPPFNVKWTSLDGTWYKRFLQEARELDPASANTLKERVKSEQNMKDYWEKMIIHTRQLSVKRTHISGSLDLLNYDGEYNTKRLRDQGFNEDEEGKSSGKALRKSKKVCYTEETEVDSDYSDYPDYSDYSDYESKPNKKSSHIEKTVNQTELDFEKFKELYLAMDPNCMWTLESGRKVEMVIYEFAKSLREESYLHSFIINDADVDTKSLFSREEWEEINNFEVIERPKLDSCHRELLKKYTVDDMKKLRSLLFESFTPDGKEYDRNVHFDLDYINSAYRGILYIWEMDEDPFDVSKLEGWFQMNVWSRLIDPAFCNLIDVIRGEGMSIASSERKNAQRKNNDRKIIGKGDGVFRLRKDHWEFGAIEAGLKGTRYMSNSLKLCKMLKDMLDKLFVECEMKKNIVEKLKVVGILQGANRIQVITVDHPKGYVTRINRNKVQEIAGRLTDSKPLALVLKEILYAKSVIASTLDVFNKRNYINIETFLDDDDGYHTPEINTTIKTFTTPHNARTKDMTNEIKDK